MRPVARGAWRSVRCLLLVVCAGGILAAEDGWISTFSLDLVTQRPWFSSAAVNDAADFPVVVNAPIEIAPRARLSMGGLIHGLLFDRPAGRWALDSRTVETHSSLARRIVEFDQINPISGGDNFSAYRLPASFAPIVAAPSTVIASAVTGPTSPSAVTATNGNWISNASGNWGTAANWQGGVIADGAGGIAHFDTLDITTDVTVSLDTSRSIGELYIGDTNGTHRYSINPVGATSLTFDSGTDVPAILQQSSTSAGDTIAAPIFLATSLDVTNDSSNVLTISGAIATSGSNFTLLTFRGGDTNVTGNINNGTEDLFVGVNGSGSTVVFTGTNSYLGQTYVDDGTLLINGDNSAATETVFVSGSGSVLGGTGTVGGTVLALGGTVTGATTGTVGTLTFSKNVELSTGEGGGTYWADLSGALSDLLDITGSLTLGEGSTLDIHGTGNGTTTYTLATFASRIDFFETVMGVPGGYTLVYHDTDIQLVPTAIPEPSTWIGGALAVAALAFTQRRRHRRR